MAIANVALTDTFDYWRTVTNQTVTALNDKLVYFNTANTGVISVTPNASRLGNVFINVSVTSAITDVSSLNIASILSVNIVSNVAVASYKTVNAAFGFANTINAFAYYVEDKANAAFQQANSFSIIVANTRPAAPVQGSIWWHNEYGKLFVYYRDGDTDQWVDTSPAYDVTFLQDSTNVAFNQSNTAFAASNVSYSQSNTALIIANNTANSVGFISLTANLAYSQANLAYANANTRLANTSGGTFAGNLNFSGNLTLSTAGSNSSITLDGLRVGYLEIPQIRQSANYVASYADSGKHIIHPSTDDNPRIFTIPSNASVPYANGTVLTFINTANVVTINIASDTMYWAGETSNTGTRYLSSYGMATAVKIDKTIWIISGTNLS
jgi:hypothetical protein